MYENDIIMSTKQWKCKHFEFLNGGIKIATDMNGDIQQPDEPLEGAAEVVDEMDFSQSYAAIAAADASRFKL